MDMMTCAGIHTMVNGVCGTLIDLTDTQICTLRH